MKRLPTFRHTPRKRTPDEAAEDRARVAANYVDEQLDQGTAGARAVMEKGNRYKYRVMRERAARGEPVHFSSDKKVNQIRSRRPVTLPKFDLPD